MTIAAGFLYDGGLFICADTQATGRFKIHGSKLLPREYDDRTRTIFATVGHFGYARMGVQLVEQAIDTLGKGKRTLGAVHDTLINEIYSLFLKHLYTHPSWNTDADLHVQYLIGVWSPTERKVGFFKNEDTAVQRLYGYECLGSGAELAHYLIRPDYQRLQAVDAKPAHTLEYVRTLAFNALERVKGHDPNCGGDTQWMTLTDDGQQAVGVEPVRPSHDH